MTEPLSVIHSVLIYMSRPAREREPALSRSRKSVNPTINQLPRLKIESKLEQHLIAVVVSLCELSNHC
jgi:hypothetical protein